MFKSNTVIILGAGASNEVGLPIGPELRKIIAEKLLIKFDDIGNNQISGSREIMEIFWNLTTDPDGNRGNPNPYIHASRNISSVLPQAISIDNLLYNYKDDELSQLCGKLGIVQSIIESEKSSTLYLNPHERTSLPYSKLEKTWFSGFIKKLTENVAKNEIATIFENLTILSFNYDRCFEHYVFEATKDYYNLETNEISEIMSSLKILHPYGSVGKLPWQKTDDLIPVGFGRETNDLLALSKQIKTFNERAHEKEELEEIKETFKQAEIIVFLGFAYHEQNLELLAPKSSSKAKRIYATASGISKNDCEVIQNDLKRILMQKKSQSLIHLRSDLKCYDLFNEYWRSLSDKV